MKKTLTIATLLSLVAVPSFAQSFDPDIGTGNIVPPVANQGGVNAYAQAPVRPYAYNYGGGPYYRGGRYYYYGGPRSYYQRPYRHWTEF